MNGENSSYLVRKKIRIDLFIRPIKFLYGVEASDTRPVVNESVNNPECKESGAFPTRRKM
ncbi:hypothetical protein WN55_10617 [Dufourea novaeangliae]|uniref:Uncharacterized protein n=1 Tax=Dufourea novaeangliae TaxID=178035 RepID=A0A154P5T4_DUFNO|nr:hypothetical protein WN55_10617 [Dufourea novaeangliae]